MSEQPSSNHRRKGIMLVLSGSGLWGISGVSTQYLLQDLAFSSEWLVVVRLLLSGIILLTCNSLLQKQNIWLVLHHPADFCRLCLFSVVGMLAIQYTYFLAIQYGNAAIATILQNLSPVFIACYMLLINRRMPPIMLLLAIALAFSGTFMLSTRGHIDSMEIPLPALIWGIISALSAAFYIIYPKKLLQKYKSGPVVGWSMLLGGIFMSLFYSPLDFTGTWNLNAFWGTAFLIIFGTVIAFYCYLDSTQYISPAETSTLSAMEPLSAVTLSIIFLDVPFGIAEALGMALILSSVYILTKQR